MRTRSLLVLAAVVALPAWADDFKVVVNASNPVDAMSRAEVSQLFLKKVTRWPGGEVVHVAEPGSAAVRETFYRKVAGKSLSAVKSYWNQLIFSGREVPPVEKASDEDVVAFVRANPDAVGYVSAGAAAPGVKALALRE
jgi:ABC-type phosphate transport system substrate-binding protein